MRKDKTKSLKRLSFNLKAELVAISWYLAPGNTDVLECACLYHAVYEVLVVTWTCLKSLNSVIWDILRLFKRETIEAWCSVEPSVAACVIHWGGSFLWDIRREWLGHQQWYPGTVFSSWREGANSLKPDSLTNPKGFIDFHTHTNICIYSLDCIWKESRSALPFWLKCCNNKGHKKIFSGDTWKMK